MNILPGIYRLRWLCLAFMILVLDFYSKKWIMNNMLLYERYTFLPFLNIFHVHNYGVIFSLLSNQNTWQRWCLSGIAIITVIVFLIKMYCHDNNNLNNIAYALIIGGALGNILDRMYHGYVIDFLDFFINNWHFATFNLADCSIFFGVMMILFDSFIISRETAIQKK